MERVLTLTMARETIKALAMERPDYVYRCPPVDRMGMVGASCRYWHPSEDGPGCLIGAALHRLWPEIFTGDFLCDHEGYSPKLLLEGAGVAADQLTIEYLNVAQGLQDAAESWRSSYEQTEQWLVERQAARN